MKTMWKPANFSVCKENGNRSSFPLFLFSRLPTHSTWLGQLDSEFLVCHRWQEWKGEGKSWEQGQLCCCTGPMYPWDVWLLILLSQIPQHSSVKVGIGTALLIWKAAPKIRQTQPADDSDSDDEEDEEEEVPRPNLIKTYKDSWFRGWIRFWWIGLRVLQHPLASFSLVSYCLLSLHGFAETQPCVIWQELQTGSGS